MKKIKDRFHGIFMWSGQSFHFHGYYFSEDQAKNQFLTKLSKVVKYDLYLVQQQFNNRCDNYMIRKFPR
jgi:hypothetical protein